jgi:uridine kinase
MMLSLPPGEPAAGPWHVRPVEDLARQLMSAGTSPAGRPRVVAVDGRGGSGKSTLAGQLRAVIPRSAVVHTDDVAWHHSFFDWADLLAEHVLGPLRAGRAVRYRPPGWVTKQRPGAIEVPAGTDLVVVEGVGAGRRELAHLLDAVVWVQSDLEEAERRGLARDLAAGVEGGEAAARRFWDEWMAEELPFLAEQRPWERATVIVRGTTALPHDPAHVVTAEAPVRSAAVRPG